MKRVANPHLSPSGKLALAEYEQRLCEREDLTPSSIRNSLSNVLDECPGGVFLFPSGKTKKALSERALGYIVKKYAVTAKLPDISPHDLRTQAAVAEGERGASAGQ